MESLLRLWIKLHLSLLHHSWIWPLFLNMWVWLSGTFIFSRRKNAWSTILFLLNVSQLWCWYAWFCTPFNSWIVFHVKEAWSITLPAPSWLVRSCIWVNCNLSLGAIAKLQRMWLLAIALLPVCMGQSLWGHLEIRLEGNAFLLWILASELLGIAGKNYPCLWL